MQTNEEESGGLLVPEASVTDYYNIPKLSVSGINSYINKSPAHYWQESPFNPNRVPFKDTASKLLGRVTHKLIFEGAVFGEEYLIGIDKDDYPEALDTMDDLRNFLRTKDITPKGTKKDDVILQVKQNYPQAQIWAEVQEAHTASAGNRALISKKIYGEAKILADAMMNNEIFKQLVILGEPEHPIEWNNGIIDCKAKLDYYRLQNNAGTASGLVIDYKTSMAADEDSFVKSIAGWGYHRQAAMYMDGVEAVYGERPRGFVFMVQDKSLPEAIGFYALTEDGSDLTLPNGYVIPADNRAVAIGRRENMRVSAEIKDRLARNDWRAYPQEIINVELPTWYKEYGVNYRGEAS